MNDSERVTTPTPTDSSGAMPSGVGVSRGDAVRSAVRGMSYESGSQALAPRSEVQKKASRTVQKVEAVQREEDPNALAESILAAVQTDYKTSPVRQAYEAEVAALKSEADGMLDGKDRTQDDSIADVARTMNQRRLDIGRKYKDLTILPLRDYIYFANSQRYDTPYGPSYEFLRNKGKSNLQVIEGSSRPNPDINSFLAPFGAWLKSQNLQDLKRYQSAVQGGGT